MVYIDVTPLHPVHSATGRIFRIVAKWVVGVRAKRQKRAALQSLLFAPEHHLRDLGIEREELIHAIESRRR